MNLTQEEKNKLRQLFKNRSNCYADADDVIQAMDEDCFVETVNEYQSERKYSEEEVLNILNDYGYAVVNEDKINSIGTIKKWFEQFKKK